MQSNMTPETIDAMSDDEILALTIPHPEAAGQRAFSFTLRDFDGDRVAMAACMAALVSRMQKIQK